MKNSTFKQCYQEKAARPLKRRYRKKGDETLHYASAPFRVTAPLIKGGG